MFADNLFGPVKQWGYLVKDLDQATTARRFCCLGYGSTSAKKQKFTKQEIQSPVCATHAPTVRL